MLTASRENLAKLASKTKQKKKILHNRKEEKSESGKKEGKGTKKREKEGS